MSAALTYRRFLREYKANLALGMDERMARFLAWEKALGRPPLYDY